jgi:hypothetical protein
MASPPKVWNGRAWKQFIQSLRLPDFPSLKNRNDEFNYLKSAREILKIRFALGVLAGIGSGIVGSISTLLSMLLGTIIGRSYNGNILPFVIGMIVLTAISIFLCVGQ